MVPRKDGDDDQVVVHFGIPPALWQTWCPFRAVRVPGVKAHLEAVARTRRYGLPGGRGWANEPERHLQACDVVEWAVRQPLAELPRSDRG